MPEGILKTAEQISTKQPLPNQAPQETKSTFSDKDIFGGIHLEVYRYFDINSAERGTDNHLKTVFDWASDDSKNIAETLRKIKNLEIKLGQPALGESRINRLYNYVRMSGHIKETTLTMNQELNRIRSRYQLELGNIQKNYKDRIGKINEEIARIEGEHRQVYGTLKNRNKTEMDKIRSEYEEQLTELKSIQQVYGGEK